MLPKSATLELEKEPSRIPPCVSTTGGLPLCGHRRCQDLGLQSCPSCCSTRHCHCAFSAPEEAVYSPSQTRLAHSWATIPQVWLALLGGPGPSCAILLWLLSCPRPRDSESVLLQDLPLPGGLSSCATWSEGGSCVREGPIFPLQVQQGSIVVEAAASQANQGCTANWQTMWCSPQPQHQSTTPSVLQVGPQVSPKNQTHAMVPILLPSTQSQVQHLVAL